MGDNMSTNRPCLIQKETDCSVVVLIPAYSPGGKLIQLIQDLNKRANLPILVVNDGSSVDSDKIFSSIQGIENVVVITHQINQGKGAALKTGFRYIQNNFVQCKRIVTADADGQHSVEDIIRIAEFIAEDDSSLVLGMRKFGNDVPLRSKFGNLVTKYVMRIVTGLRINDTQTGLRGIPYILIDVLISIPYNRYEFEMEMILVCKRENIRIREVSIKTIYIDENSDSHFNPVIDSIRIYFTLLRYFFASVITAVVDYIFFIVAFSLTESITTAVYCGRAIALFINFFLLKKVVFFSKEKSRKSFPKYLLLVIVSGLLSSAMIHYLSNTLSTPIILAKLLSDSLLYIANFSIQREFIFTKSINDKIH